MLPGTVAFRWTDVWRCNTTWEPLNKEFDLRYMEDLETFLDGELASNSDFHPAPEHIFKAFELTALKDVNVVILGQDPYPPAKATGLSKATGLAFSVNDGKPNDKKLDRKKFPPSLKNIYDAIQADRRKKPRRTGDLTPWTEDGVLLLNTILTIGDKPKSHAKQGWWECFTNRAIKVISDEREAVIFLLWGEQALRKAQHVNPTRHYILPAAHPVAHANARLPLSRSRHFSLTNCLLEADDRDPIGWLDA